MTDRFLCHFTLFSFTETYWSSTADIRKRQHADLLTDLRGGIPHFDLYQVFPARTEADVLLWSTQPVSDPGDPARYFECLGKIINSQRSWLRPVHTLWGFTGASSYARGKSDQAIDPLAEERQPYLVVYPFTKTVDWYRTGRDTRQGMMNEHIRIGHQYEQIRQLLLYSTGIQDQEFVVVYETEDLPRFSDLVVELRASEGRRYTERDTPIFTAVHHAPEETLALSA
jgi:chlorite dismutase